jgi:branched-chain amino acid transport system permease protein
MQTAALAVVSGLLYGCTLLLIATGLTLIFGVGRVVNFAHGTLYALGAFLGASMHAVAGLLVACLLAPALIAVVAVVLDLLVIRWLRRRGEMAVLLFTFGLGIVIDAAITGIWGARSYAVAVPDALAGAVRLFGGQVSVYSIALAGISLAATGLLIAVLHATPFGLRLRAAAENPAMAEIAGVDVDRAFTAVLAVGSGFAALAGVLVLPMVGASNGMDLTVTVLVFIVVITGGLGSLLGTAIASLLVGVILTLGATYASSAAYLLLFAAVIVMLLVRPFGLVPSRAG